MAVTPVYNGPCRCPGVGYFLEEGARCVKCRECELGQYVAQECNATANRQCSPCPNQKPFSSEYTVVLLLLEVLLLIIVLLLVLLTSIVSVVLIVLVLFICVLVIVIPVLGECKISVLRDVLSFVILILDRCSFVCGA